MIKLYEHQINALKNMHNGCILNGGVGSGKSLTSLAYFVENICKVKEGVNKIVDIIKTKRNGNK